METINEDSNEDFLVNHNVTLYDFDKKTEIFTLEIDFDGYIDDIDFSSDLLKIGNESEKLPLNE